MRKIFIIAIVLFAHNTASAQFEQGKSFIGGTFFSYLNTYKNLDQGATANTYSHDMDISLGKFVKANKAAGWSLTHNLSIQKLEVFNTDPKPVRNFGVGVQRFWEFYKPLNEKFSIYARPSIGLSYNLLNEYTPGASDGIDSENRTNKITLGASIGAGLAWRIKSNWVLMGGLAFSNPFNISTSFSREENFRVKASNGENRKTNNTNVEYQFVPGISSGGISLGFRYLF